MALDIPEHGQGQPQEEDELEGEVEGEPVDDVHQALNDPVASQYGPHRRHTKAETYVKEAKTTQYC